MPRKSLEEEKTPIRERIADAMDIPKEGLFDTVLISCIGNQELTLENYKSILAYSDTCIRIKANPKPVKITGARLELRNITRELLYIVGRIDKIELETRAERQT